MDEIQKLIYFANFRNFGFKSNDDMINLKFITTIRLLDINWQLQSWSIYSCQNGRAFSTKKGCKKL